MCDWALRAAAASRAPASASPRSISPRPPQLIRLPDLPPWQQPATALPFVAAPAASPVLLGQAWRQRRRLVRRRALGPGVSRKSSRSESWCTSSLAPTSASSSGTQAVPTARRYVRDGVYPCRHARRHGRCNGRADDWVVCAGQWDGAGGRGSTMRGENQSSVERRRTWPWLVWLGLGLAAVGLCGARTLREGRMGGAWGTESSCRAWCPSAQTSMHACVLACSGGGAPQSPWSHCTVKTEYTCAVGPPAAPTVGSRVHDLPASVHFWPTTGQGYLLSLPALPTCPRPPSPSRDASAPGAGEAVHLRRP